MATHLLHNMPSGQIKVKKGSGHVSYLSTPCHTIESVRWITLEIGQIHLSIEAQCDHHPCHEKVKVQNIVISWVF